MIVDGLKGTKTVFFLVSSKGGSFESVCLSQYFSLSMAVCLCHCMSVLLYVSVTVYLRHCMTESLPALSPLVSLSVSFYHMHLP